MPPRHLLTALFLGLALGLMLAGAPSCGSAPSVNACGPANCQGCCSGNTCIGSPGNAKVATCGQNGGACTHCGARPCVDFSCVGGNDAGSGGVCGPSNCAGCCSGTSSSSVCISSPTATNCGASGGLCNSCGAGQACAGGKCLTRDGGAGQVGTACSADTECAALGANHVCKKKFTNSVTTYQDGYCTRLCVADVDCPSAALCLGPQPGYGENDSVCWARCASAQECRSGYLCYNVGGGEAACWVDPLPTYDAGAPADKVGQACGLDSTCQNPPDDGACLTDRLIDGGASAFVGGYCSAPCDDSSHCSADGGALCVSLGAFGACAQSCTSPLLGRGACREGYVCRSIRASADGGAILPVGFCWPSCKSSGCPTGSVCQTSGYCG